MKTVKGKPFGGSSPSLSVLLNNSSFKDNNNNNMIPTKQPYLEEYASFLIINKQYKYE